jgi:hypothetical protein
MPVSTVGHQESSFEKIASGCEYKLNQETGAFYHIHVRYCIFGPYRSEWTRQPAHYDPGICCTADRVRVRAVDLS